MNNLAYFFVEFIGCFLEIYLTGFLATAIFNERRNFSFSQKIGGFVIFSLLNFAGFLYFYFFYNEKIFAIVSFTKSFLLCFILPFVLCKIKISWALLVGSGIYIAWHLADMAVHHIVIIPRRLTYDNYSQFGIFVWVQIYTIYCISMFLISKYILWIKKGNVKRISLKLIPILVLTIICFRLYFIDDLFEIIGAPYLTYLSMEENTLTIFFSLTLITISIFLQTRNIIQHREKERELKIIEKQLSMQKEHTAQMVQKQEQIQFMAHDFKQHIHTLQGLSNSGNLQEVIEALQELSKQQLKGIKYLNTGNVMLDALLSIKREIAEKENIVCDWNITTPVHLPIKELDTCVIFGNALDNAIEACRKSMDKKEEKPYIKLDLYVESDWLLCGITNPMDQPPKVDKGIFKTSKSEDQHGFGLKSMKQCCESMGGNMEIFHDEKLFTVRFMLPLNTD